MDDDFIQTINGIEKRKLVSFSQFNLWIQCPYRWKLDYVCGFKQPSNIHIIFGQTIHKLIQSRIQDIFSNGKNITIDSEKIKESFLDLFMNALKEANVQESEEVIVDFIKSGLDIINDIILSKQIDNIFDPEKYILLGIEYELNYPTNRNVDYIGYIDVILKNRKDSKIEIFDIKISKNGWGKFEKTNWNKLAQLIFYKKFYSDINNVDMHDIIVKFLIIKRIDPVPEDSIFKIRRWEIFSPSIDNSLFNSVFEKFDLFLTECFNIDGSYKADGSFPKVPGKNKKNCRFCHHLNVRCDGKIES